MQISIQSYVIYFFQIQHKIYSMLQKNDFALYSWKGNKVLVNKYPCWYAQAENGDKLF